MWEGSSSVSGRGCMRERERERKRETEGEKEGGRKREGEMASRFMIDIDMTAESNKADK